MERERGLDKDICAQAMVAMIFFFLPLCQGTKTFPSEGVFWNCFMQMGGLQRCFLIRGYHGLARVHERKKNGSRTEGCDDVVTRLDPIATHMARWNLE